MPQSAPTVDLAQTDIPQTESEQHRWLIRVFTHYISEKFQTTAPAVSVQFTPHNTNTHIHVHVYAYGYKHELIGITMIYNQQKTT